MSESRPEASSGPRSFMAVSVNGSKGDCLRLPFPHALVMCATECHQTRVSRADPRHRRQLTFSWRVERTPIYAPIWPQGVCEPMRARHGGRERPGHRRRLADMGRGSFDAMSMSEVRLCHGLRLDDGGVTAIAN